MVKSHESIKPSVYSGLFGPTGGANYHARALWRSDLWAQYQFALNLQLEKFRPKRQKLLLIGPSRGRCLESNFLKKFADITCYDIDPSAKYMFHLRHRNISAQWKREDAFFDNASNPFSIARIKSILSEHKNHAIVFCNVLGQLGISHRDLFNSTRGYEQKKKFSLWKNELVTLLESRDDWFSFHDLASTSKEPANQRGKYLSGEVISELNFRSMFFDTLEKPSLRWHGWQNKFIGHDRVMLHWPLSPRRHHFIECVGS